MAEKRERKPQPQQKAKKKRWESPRVKSGQLFESNSLACAKTIPDDPPQCGDYGLQQS